MAVMPHVGRRASLLAIGNAAAFSVILFTNDVVPSPNSVLADLVLATYSGYAALGPNFPAPATGVDGKARTVGTGCVFAHNGGGVPNLVKGWALRSNVGNLHALELLPVPKLMAALGDILTITLTHTYTQEP